ncbi:MAG: hypothetical protein SGCHY_004674 [Lobulomycetales sp.]
MVVRTQRTLILDSLDAPSTLFRTPGPICYLEDFSQQRDDAASVVSVNLLALTHSTSDILDFLVHPSQASICTLVHHTDLAPPPLSRPGDGRRLDCCLKALSIWTTIIECVPGGYIRLRRGAGGVETEVRVCLRPLTDSVQHVQVVKTKTQSPATEASIPPNNASSAPPSVKSTFNLESSAEQRGKALLPHLMVQLEDAAASKEQHFPSDDEGDSDDPDEDLDF